MRGAAVVIVLLVVLLAIFFESQVVGVDSRLDSLEKRASAMDSRQGNVDELKNQMTSLDQELDQLQHLLNPTATNQSTGSALPSEVEDGTYQVEMIDPHDCDTPKGDHVVAVCAESIALSQKENRTVLTILMSSIGEITVTETEIKNSFITDDQGDHITVGEVDPRALEPVSPQNPSRAFVLHSGTRIYPYLVFDQRVSGKAREFQLNWFSQDYEFSIITFRLAGGPQSP